MMSTTQRIIRFFSSSHSFSRAEAESKAWYFRCDCGCEFSIWDLGGIRYKAKGHPQMKAKCPKCDKRENRPLLYRNK